MPGARPSLTKLAPYFASSAPIRRSQTRARPNPPPTVWPLSAPITGTAMSSSDRNGSYIEYERSLGARWSASRCAPDLKWAPAEKQAPGRRAGVKGAAGGEAARGAGAARAGRAGRAGLGGGRGERVE